MLSLQRQSNPWPQMSSIPFTLPIAPARGWALLPQPSSAASSCSGRAGGALFLGTPLPGEQGQILAAGRGTPVPRTGPGGWQHPAGSLPGALWHLRAQNCCTTDPKSRHQSLGHLLGVRGLSSAVALRSASPLLAALLAALPKPAGSQRCLAACSERASLGHGDVPGVKQPSRDRRGSDGRRKRFRVSSSVLN